MSTITITGDLLKKVDAIRERLVPSRITTLVGKAVLEQRKRHLIEYGRAHPSRLGGKTGYYQRAAENTAMTVNGASVSVTTTHVGINQRIYGGLIQPSRGKYLTIPVDVQAVNRNARSMNLVPIIRYIGGKARMVALAMPGSGGKSGKTMFAMRESVRQIGDPAVIPNESQVNQAIEAQLERNL